MPAAPQPRTAARRYLEALGIAVDCVTPRRLFVQPAGYDPGALYTVAFGRMADPVALPAKAGGSSGLLLDIRQLYAIVPDHVADRAPAWRVRTRAYEYRILDGLEQELLVFHWQPNALGGGPDYPHLHVSATVEARSASSASQRFSLEKRHVPTGRVSLAAIVRLLIAEFGIAYRHRNWSSRLQRAEDVLQREQGQEL